jgi:large subunit ribosomal protein L30e
MAFVDQLRIVLRSGKLVYGTKQSEEQILNGKVKVLIISKKAESNTFERLKYLADLGKVPCKVMDISTKELGETFALAYPVSVAAVLDEGDSKIVSEVKNEK